MFKVLQGMRIVEASAFVAAPLSGMTLSQLGADVIRFDPLVGGMDARRWPITQDGKSLYWAGLNKGKRSLAIDATKPQAQELLTRLITEPGEGKGIFLTNFPASKGWMSYESLKKHRKDLIMVNLIGSSDGTSAVDYTVNCACGFPYVTGNHHSDPKAKPINHVLPAWDAIAGINLALAVLAAERHRRLTGEGQFVKIALSDIAFAMTANLGYVSEVQINKEDRKGYGNYLYGAYGSDYETKDGRRIYIVVVTDRMWTEVAKVTGLTDTFKEIETKLGKNFKKEGDRFLASDEISVPIRQWCSQRTLKEIENTFQNTGVCWGPYRTFRQMVEEDTRVSTQNPLFSMVDQPGIGSYLVPGSPIDFSAFTRDPPKPAPILGQHTDEILGRDLGLGAGEIKSLRDAGIVAGPVEIS
ncbi:MAG: acyl-CoA transferase/carnitine dehydratase-like protein [Magnetococcales bacterium]|nr:acyl-CoA transferase/carnitine dehydratase-like protein [Magnetococcales bacterium]HIJ84231.1 2-methylfumaryl-CoA isomerase [Magnetococcales bacterium]